MLHLKAAVARRRASWTFCNCGDSVECEDRGRETHIRTRAVERGSFVNSKETSAWISESSFEIVFLGGLWTNFFSTCHFSWGAAVERYIYHGCESIERKSVDPDTGMNVFRDFVFVFTWSWILGLATRLQMIVDMLFNVCSQITRMWDVVPPSNALKVKSMTPCLSYSMPN